jgi:hypothetical protein
MRSDRALETADSVVCLLFFSPIVLTQSPWIPTPSSQKFTAACPRVTLRGKPSLMPETENQSMLRKGPAVPRDPPGAARGDPVARGNRLYR